MFKFKKYKKGYKDRKRGASPKYSHDIGSLLRVESQGPPKSSVTHADKVETSLNAPSSDATPLVSSSLPSALNAGQLAGASSICILDKSQLF